MRTIILRSIAIIAILSLNHSLAKSGTSSGISYTRQLLCTATPDISIYLVRRLVSGRSLLSSECLHSPYVESEALEIVKNGNLRRVNLQYLRCLPIVTAHGDTVFVLQIQIELIHVVRNTKGDVVGYMAYFGSGQHFQSSYCPTGQVVFDPNGKELYAWVGVQARVGLDGRTFIDRGRPEVYYRLTPIEGGYSFEQREDLHDESCWSLP
jgi:hypothetical protein